MITNEAIEIEEELEEILTDKQVFQIRQQILAYKYLIRTIPIPRDVE